MNRTSRSWFLLLLAIWCCSGCLSRQQNVDHLFRDYQGAVPGAAVMVIHKGRAVVDTGYGLANLAEKVRVASGTNFRLAQVTKQFTAMCIRILKERGKLNFSTSDYIHGPRKCFSGGAGLLSTITDYGRFLQMLLNRGELDGVRLLSPKTIELIRVNHVGDMFPWGNRGFGLGFWVIEALGEYGEVGSVGSYGWGSAIIQNI